jgi:hypothetical protein
MNGDFAPGMPAREFLRKLREHLAKSAAEHRMQATRALFDTSSKEGNASYLAGIQQAEVNISSIVGGFLDVYDNQESPEL